MKNPPIMGDKNLKQRVKMNSRKTELILKISALLLGLSACDFSNNAQDFNAVMFIIAFALFIPVLAIIFAIWRFKKKKQRENNNEQ